MATNPGHLNHIDYATASVIVDVQLADLYTLKQGLKRKECGGEPSDAAIAMSLQTQELNGFKRLLLHRRMTQSIGTVVKQDGLLVAQALAQEELAYSDRACAYRLNGNTMIPEIPSQLPKIDEQTLSKLAGRYMSESSGWSSDEIDDKVVDRDDDQSDQQGRTVQELTKVRRRCEACREFKSYFDVIAGPCQHEYCRDCLHELFEASFVDETLFPPRCCRQPMTFSSVGIFLTSDLRNRFEEKIIEFSTPDRTYCCNIDCTSFLQRSAIHENIGTCSKCGMTTCTICKSASHSGECPQDPAYQAVVDLAKEQNWQRCLGCRRMVELDTGCNHITCPCGAQFCYVCGLRWKLCTCDAWTEANLLARANVIVDRAPLPPPAEERVVYVQQAAQMLLERHDCAHRGWKYVRGRHRCEECHCRLPQYIFECRQCQIRACNRCRKNRL